MSLVRLRAQNGGNVILHFGFCISEWILLIETAIRLNCCLSGIKWMSSIDIHMMIATNPEGVANTYFSQSRPADAICAKKVHSFSSRCHLFVNF